MRQKWKDLYKYLLFVWISSIPVVFFIFADFSYYPLSGFKDIVYAIGQVLIIYTAVIACLGILAINRYLFIIVYPLLFILVGILAFYAWTTNTALTVMILDAALHNEWATSKDLLSLPLMITVGLSFLYSLFMIRYRVKKIKVTGNVWWILPACVILFSLIHFNFKRILANHIPFNLYYTTVNYLNSRQVILENRPSLHKGSHTSTDSLIVVFVLGESLRADHLGINSYQRNTTPYLSQNKNVVSFPHIFTDKTYTNISVPYIMTRANAKNEEKAYMERSFIDIFKACGFQTSWLANQEPADSFIYFVNECDTVSYVNINRTIYSSDKWLDKDLLPDLDIQLGKENPKKLIILHTIGSHWWYNSHFTDEFAPFQPVVKSRIVSSSTPEEIINSYDNSIVYTDSFIKEIITRLENKKAILLYLSDHGENLGEDNKWLHATDTPAIYNTAAFVWMSQKYIQEYPEKFEAVKNNKNKKYKTDYLFHSILDAADISSFYKEFGLSIFR